MLSSLLLYSTLFLAVIILIACAALGGLYLLCRHAHPPEERSAQIPLGQSRHQQGAGERISSALSWPRADHHH